MSIHTPSSRRVIALAVLLTVSLPSLALAASSGSEQARLAEMQKKLDRSIRMIDALAARVRELEARQAATAVAAAPVKPAVAPAAPAAPAAAADDQRIAAVEQKVAQIETANATRHADDSGLPLHGFADVGVGNRNPYFPAYKGFYVNNLDFYLTPHLGEHTRALFELNNEVDADGSIGIDLERAQLGYQFSDAATVWLGRFHTPYGFVNTAVHHGAWINDALRRPAFLQFEDHGGILPAHTVGLWLTGSEHASGGRLQYDGYIGNSQLIQGGFVDMRNAGNAHGKLIVGGRIGYEFEGGTLDGLLVGVHALSVARIEDDLPIPNATRVTAYGAYASFDSDRWEHNAEVYIFNNEDLSGATGSHHSDAEYAQLGVRVSWGVPYVRIERTSLDQNDQYFFQQLSGGSYERGALGTRFDLDSRSALKFELAETHLTDRSRERYTEEQVQYAIRFEHAKIASTMKHTLNIALLGAALAAWAGAAAAGAAAAGDVYVVCNSDVTLQAADIRDVFIGEKGFAGSVHLAPADNSAAQAAFLEKVLKMYASKYTGLWTKKSFRDGSNPPPLKNGDAEALAYVKQTSGACSYVGSAPGGGVTFVGKF